MGKPPVRVAVVGCGAWGRNVARAFADCGALGAVCDHHPEVTSELSRRHGVPALDFESVLAAPDIEAVAVVTQPSHHAALAQAAIAAGKHVFIEKPLADTLDQARGLVQAAARARRVLMVGHILRHHPAFQSLLARVRGGEIGRVRHVRAHRLAFGAIRHEEDVIACLAPHDVSMILALAGAKPDRVEARVTHALGRANADMASLSLDFPGGCRAEIAASWLHPFKEQRLVVTGDDGIAVFDDRETWERKVVLTPFRRTAGHGPGGHGSGAAPVLAEARPIATPPAEPLLAECRDFLDAIATGRPPLTDGAEGLAVMEVLEAARNFLLTRRPS